MGNENKRKMEVYPDKIPVKAPFTNHNQKKNQQRGKIRKT